jgi:tetratricopeptide (TPR) repeat protein
MTTLILYALLWLWDHRTFDSITRANERKIIAQKAYADKRYKDAAILYDQIAYGSVFSEPAARLNLAHAYFKNGELDKALKQYGLLAHVTDHGIASVANTQLAIIRVTKRDTASALHNLKTALTLEPGNELARANYIILKNSYSGEELPADNKIPQKKPKSETESAPSPTPPDTQNKENEVEESTRKEQLLTSLKAMNMSEEQARTILDAMKSNESQYIYQLRRKQYAKKAGVNKQTEW